MVNQFSIVFKEKINLSSTTKHFKFVVTNTQKFAYKAGQFISLHINKDGKDYRRNYSIANPPLMDNILEIAMTYLPNGLASTLLSNLKPGEVLKASGPYGQFFLKDEILPQRYLLIGTGTGITPYRSMLPTLSKILNINNKMQVIILEGIHSKHHVLYANDFIKFSTSYYPNAKFIICYSRKYPKTLKKYELSGYIQEHLQDLNINPKGDIAYLCGNPNMVDDTFQQLQKLGMNRNRIRREKYLLYK